MLSVEDYEKMAKAYAEMLRKNGIQFINIAEDVDQNVISNITKIKSLLFALGGFLNTGKFYSLNERHINKLSIIFDQDIPLPARLPYHDKTKCFLSFLSNEFALIQQLFSIVDKTRFDGDIKNIINDRLSLLSQILAL